MGYIPSNIVDYLATLDCREVAGKLNIAVDRHFKAFCFKHTEKNPSLSFRKDGSFWFCFSCREGGNAISLVEKYFNIDFQEACVVLGQLYNINIPIDQEQKSRIKQLRYRSQRKPALLTNKSHFNPLISEWLVDNAGLSELAKNFLFKERKLSPNVIGTLKIKSVTDSVRLVNSLRSCFPDQELEECGIIKNTSYGKYPAFFTPCLLIPYYNEKGNLSGLQTRYLGTNEKAPRFQFIGDTRPSMFNAQIISSMCYGETLHIAEGVTDCLALLSSGYKAIAIPSATNIPEECLDRLTDFQCVYCMDRDTAGEKAFRALRSLILIRRGRFQLFDYPNGFKDYGEYYKSIK